MKNKKVYITKAIIGEESLSELDFELQNQFNFDYDTQEEFVEIDKDNNKFARADGAEIKIDSLIDLIVKYKNKGATHIQLSNDVDHYGYDISFLNIKLSNKEEIEEYENKKEQSNKKDAKIQELYQQINKIKNEK